MYESNTGYVERALRAYFKTFGLDADQPSNLSDVDTASNGRQYVVIRGGRNDNRICAVYRIQKNGRLKRLERWPRELEDF